MVVVVVDLKVVKLCVSGREFGERVKAAVLIECVLRMMV